MVEKVEKGYKVEKVPEVSAKISPENHERLMKLAGQLQTSRGKRQSLDDAITYLFENQKKEKSP